MTSSGAVRAFCGSAPMFGLSPGIGHPTAGACCSEPPAGEKKDENFSMQEMLPTRLFREHNL